MLNERSKLKNMNTFIDSLNWIGGQFDYLEKNNLFNLFKWMEIKRISYF